MPRPIQDENPKKAHAGAALAVMSRKFTCLAVRCAVVGCKWLILTSPVLWLEKCSSLKMLSALVDALDALSEIL
jgi:hypothetical protein